MPLHDHFRPPGNRLPWESLHSGWLGHLAERVNTLLPPGYIALDRMRIDGGFEVDVGVEEEGRSAWPDSGDTNTGGAAIATTRAVYTPPDASGTTQYHIADIMELRVLSESDGRLVAAVELVSPGNKDRDTKREAFLSKCVDYIASGACVVIVDVITERRANLHNDMVERLGAPEELALPEENSIYAVTYRPIMRNKRLHVDMWIHSLQVGEALPTLPLRIVGDFFVPLELEETYAAACRGRKFVI